MDTNNIFFVYVGAEPFFSNAYTHIRSDLNISESLIQLCPSVFFLGFAIGTFICGDISEIWGRKPVVIMGFVMYCVSVSLMIFTDHIHALLLLKLLQGIGISVGSISHFIIRDSYTEQEQSNVYCNVGMIVSITPMLGSIMGNLTVDYTNWRYNCGVLSAVSCLIILVSYFKLPETNTHIGKSATKTKYIDVLKLILKDRNIILHMIIIGLYLGMMFGFIFEAPFFNDSIGIKNEYNFIMFVIMVSCLIGNMLNRKMLKCNVRPQKL